MTSERPFKPIELWHGDCLELMSRIPDGSVDMVFCDLPYGMTANRWDVCIDLGLLWQNILRISRHNSPFIFTAAQPFATMLFNSKKDLFRYDLIWQKNRKSGFLNAKNAPLRSHEIILVFYATKPTYNPQMTYVAKTRGIIRSGTSPRPSKNHGVACQTHTLSHYRYPASVLTLNRDDKRDGKGHPTQKPVALLEWLIRTYTNKNDTILDPTAGSMTTAVAAHQTGRRAICIEKDAEYYRKGVDRVRQAMAKPRQTEMAL